MEPFIIALLISAAVALALSLFYIYLIYGRRHHPDFPDFYGHLYAHRGLFSNDTPDAPENSMAAFRRAVGHGFGIELDVHISADGELFVFHDENMRRMCGVDSKIETLCSAEIGTARLLGGEEHVPRFEDVLGLVAGQVPLIVELKCEPLVDPAPLCRAAAAMLASYPGSYCVESFNPYVVRWFRQNAPGVFRGQLSERFFTRGTQKGNGAARLALENLWLNMLSRPDFVAYNCRHTDALAYRLWRHTLRLPTALWTVRDPDTLRTLRRKCDCIIFEGFVPGRDL